MPRRRPSDPYQSARDAGLRYVSDDTPGIARVRCGPGFCYRNPDGKPVRDRTTLKRIQSLVIPPAWTSVWICPLANGHIQAVGRDARGRKQYRYHPLYRAFRDTRKFSRMAAFGKALPAIRRKVRRDLNTAGLPREKVLATVVRLLEQTAIRVGNEEYVAANNSHGLTTLRDKHVDIAGDKLHFRFMGKSRLKQDIVLTDRKIASILRRCQELPGHELFHYIDDSGAVSKINSEDVNSYLREIAGDDFTAKDFRTWVGSCQAAVELERIGPASSSTEAAKNIVQAVKCAASKLGNTPATCRKYYVHPAITEAYTDGRLFKAMERVSAKPAPLRREELCFLRLMLRAANGKRKAA